MHLVSCDNCGVVIDLDKIGVPDPYDCPIEKKVWDGDGYVPAVECPVCKSKVKAS